MPTANHPTTAPSTCARPAMLRGDASVVSCTARPLRKYASAGANDPLAMSSTKFPGEQSQIWTEKKLIRRSSLGSTCRLSGPPTGYDHRPGAEAITVARPPLRVTQGPKLIGSSYAASPGLRPGAGGGGRGPVSVRKSQTPVGRQMSGRLPVGACPVVCSDFVIKPGNHLFIDLEDASDAVRRSIPCELHGLALPEVSFSCGATDWGARVHFRNAISQLRITAICLARLGVGLQLAPRTRVPRGPSLCCGLRTQA